MTYDAIERSAAGGRPVELFEFRRGTVVWRYTSADQDVFVDEFTYSRAIIDRSNVERGSEMNRSGLRLTVARDFPIVAMFIVSPPVDVVSLTVRQYHEGDGATVVIWNGRILAVTPWVNGRAEIALEPAATSMRRTGLRRVYQRQCPHVLYGARCGAVSNAFRLVAAAGLISGLDVTVAGTGVGDGYYAGGFLQWTTAEGLERRFIVGHTGTTLSLSTPPTGLSTGTAIEVFPGCDHSLATCDAKFGNATNYGGTPFIPTKNPFGSAPIY